MGPFQNEVVARGTDVDGEALAIATKAGTSLRSSKFTVNTATMATGDAVFDNRLQAILETDTYPTAQFVQSDAVPLPSASQLASGASIDLPGTLTLHGRSNAVVIPVRLTLNGNVLTVVGSIPFRLADYDIYGVGLISVGETGTMAFHLVMGR